MGLNSGGFCPWKARMGRGTAKRAVSSPILGVKMRNEGPVQEDVQCLDAGKYILSFTWKGSAAWCGSAVPESLPAPNPLGQPRPGSSGNAGNKGTTLLEKWVCVSWKGRLGAGCLIHGREKKSPGLERSRGKAAALHCTSLEGEDWGDIWSAGRGPKHRLNTSGSSHLLEIQSLFHIQSHPTPAGLVSKIAPSLCFLWIF